MLAIKKKYYCQSKSDFVMQNFNKYNSKIIKQSIIENEFDDFAEN